jgi:multiple sugar transport system permease protein
MAANPGIDTTITGPQQAQTRSRQIPIGGYIINSLLIGVALFMIMPFIWMFSTSLRTPAESFTLPPQWLPLEPRFENYLQVFQSVPFFAFVLNSVKVTVIVTLAQLFFCSTAAYAFARMTFPAKNVLFLLLMSSLMVPGSVTIVPIFILIRYLNLADTHWSLILPAITSAFGIFLLRQFFLTIPTELEDAAKIDGANPLQIYSRIILPLGAPALSVLAIFTFNGTWNEFFRPLIFLKTWEKFTLPLGLITLRGVEGTGSISVVLAGVSLSILPILLVFLFAQRYLIEGITLTGLKG